MAVNTSFGRLWPHCDARAHLVTVVAPVSGARFPVHAGIAPLVAEGLRRQELGIGGPAYLCKPAQCGGFNCRPIGGTNSPSNHSGGLAIDINWTDNPFRQGARYAMPEWVWRMWESLGFYWGGRYSDFMHVEWLKTPAAAAAKIQELREGGSQEEDDMAGAFPYSLPAAAEADEAAEAKGHLEIIPVPPSNGLGAAQGARVWLQLYAGWETVTIHQLAARGAEWKDLLPFGQATEFNAGVTKSWELPAGCTAVEIRYESPEAFSALVEWRKS